MAAPATKFLASALMSALRPHPALDLQDQSSDGVVGVRRVSMSEKRASEASTVSFSERLASSQIFVTLFRDGMALVEETAGYLDGSGRSESKKLERSAALVYATESMRLTTRLMQLASWLLLHRAVKDGEMTLAQAHEEKSKVRVASCDPGDAKSIALLPSKLQDLIARSTKLQAEVRRLDATMHAPASIKAATGNPVERQLGLLRAAFERDRL
jgi:regulator of CtrA degradation